MCLAQFPNWFGYQYISELQFLGINLAERRHIVWLDSAILRSD